MTLSNSSGNSIWNFMSEALIPRVVSIPWMGIKIKKLKRRILSAG
jgi:hypothetical protein